MKAVWKYKLRLHCDIEMPKDAEILDVQKQDDDIVMWALVDITAPTEIRRFTIIMTGEKFDNIDMFYISTVTGIKGWIVGHVFEIWET